VRVDPCPALARLPLEEREAIALVMPQCSHRLPALHPLEAQVMRELWDLGEGTVRVVLDGLNRSEHRPRAYTTVMTTMARLERKGLLRRRREGNADVYIPTIEREAYESTRANVEVEALLDRYGDAALAHFARQVDQLDAKRLEELRRLAADD
jgi:predicted transcriptional regulator